MYDATESTTYPAAMRSEVFDLDGLTPAQVSGIADTVRATRLGLMPDLADLDPATVCGIAADRLEAASA